jgi:hypothetical protein
MSVIQTASTEKPKRVSCAAATKAKASRKHQPVKAQVAKTEPRQSPPHDLHVTKRDCILALLHQPNGTTIPELIEATGWQQHSIRGFLAATVKKKLGLSLASTKADGELRRYRITKRRTR